MTKTILIGATSFLSDKGNKWYSFMFGSSQLALGVYYFINSGFTFQSVVYTLIGMAFFMYAILFYMNTPIAPKVQLDNELIEIKNKLFKPSVALAWKSISEITFGKYQIAFALDNGEYVFEYNVHADTSKNIKESIREIAESKNIQVHGG